MKKIIFYAIIFLGTTLEASDNQIRNEMLDEVDLPCCSKSGARAGTRCIVGSECLSGICFYDASASKTGTCNS